jgi:dihydroxyacid dehydratase/phosphogluconate dehydratase
MLHLRNMGLLNLDVLTVTGQKLADTLDWWEQSPRRAKCRAYLAAGGQVDPDKVIMDIDTARREGLTSTLVFPRGNLAPEGAVIKATSIDPSVVGADQVYRHRGPARVFTSEQAAIHAIRGRSNNQVKPNDVIVLIGVRPCGTGMEEIYQITSALKFIPWGKAVPVLTDSRFSGVSTGVCVGHIGPEALAGGPIGRVQDGDLIEIVIDRQKLEGQINLVGTAAGPLAPEDARHLLDVCGLHQDLMPHPNLPDDTRLWAVLQAISGERPGEGT